MYFSAAEVSRVIGGILEVVPIKAYGSWAALIDAATIAYEKLPIQDQDSLAFQESGLIDCVGAPLPVEVNHLNASEDWEDQIKFVCPNSRLGCANPGCGHVHIHDVDVARGPRC